VNEVDNERLLEEVCKEEKSQSVPNNFQKDKISRLDGFPMEFFMGFFEVIEGDLLRVVDGSRRTRKMVHSFNATFIALIPKTDEHSTFKEFRPSSLCNCI